MSVLRTLVIVTCGALAAACGNLQSLKVAAPPEVIKGRAMVPAEKPAESIGIALNTFPIGSGTFISQSGGGSLAVGVLFGVVGAMVNSTAIANESDRVRNSVNPASAARIDPGMELAAAWSDARLSAKSTTSTAAVTPFIIFYLDNARENIHVIPGLRVGSEGVKGLDGASDWLGHYLFVLEQTLAPQSLGQPIEETELLALSKAVRAAYRELLKEVASDIQGDAVHNRKVASINATALRSTLMGFAGFASGDIEQGSEGRLSLRVNIDNYGPAMNRANPYFVWIFPSAKQYTYAVPPVERRATR